MRSSLRKLILGFSIFALLAACGSTAGNQGFRDRVRGAGGFARGGGGGFGGAGGGSLPPNTETVSISVSGQSRSFLVHSPTNLGSNPAVMLVLHGGGGSASGMASNNDMLTYSDREGFLAVYPEGNNGKWDVDGTGDVAFLREVANWLVANKGANSGRVYATGISNGGVMVHKLACAAPDLVAGIAPVAANFTETVYAACKPASSTPVVMFSGTADPLMLYEGGSPDLNIPGRSGGGGKLVPAETTIQFWAAKAGCGGSSSSNLADSANDGTTVTRVTYSCPRDQVTFYRINGGGHTWPGGRVTSGRMADFIGTTSQDISASATIVSFFGL